MRKSILLFALLLTLSLAGCGAANDKVVHRDGNLIITKYSDHAITDTTITHLGKTIAVSPEKLKIRKCVISRSILLMLTCIRFLLWMITERDTHRAEGNTVMKIILYVGQNIDIYRIQF